MPESRAGQKKPVEVTLSDSEEETEVPPSTSSPLTRSVATKSPAKSKARNILKVKLFGTPLTDEIKAKAESGAPKGKKRKGNEQPITPQVPKRPRTSAEKKMGLQLVLEGDVQLKLPWIHLYEMEMWVNKEKMKIFC